MRYMSTLLPHLPPNTQPPFLRLPRLLPNLIRRRHRIHLTKNIRPLRTLQDILPPLLCLPKEIVADSIGDVLPAHLPGEYKDKDDEDAEDDGEGKADGEG